MGVRESLVAAASRVITGSRKSAGAGKTNANQSLAWDMFETVPEVGTFADYVSNAMQGARLFVGTRMPDGTVEPVPDESRASQLIKSMAGGGDGQATLLADFGTNLAVAGEAWLIIIPDPGGESFADDAWHVLSTEEVTVQRGRVKAVVDGEDVDIPEFVPGEEQDQNTPVAIRVWKPSPRKRWVATSPVIRSLAVLEELRLLNAAVAAVARSRITGRGVLFVPAGTRFPVSPGQDPAEDSLLDMFVEVASTAIQQPESAAGTVPIVLEVPGDLISGVRWQEFSSDFDSLAIQLREEAIRRFATGADVPAEVLLGLGDVSHWGAWALTAEALKLGIEPRLALVCNALTAEWLRPLLRAENDPDAEDLVVWYDTSGLRSSSNKGASAIEAFRLGIVSGEAARRELGFTEADAPTAQDVVTEPPATNEGEQLPVDTTQETPRTEPGQDTVTAGAVTHDVAPALSAAVDGIVHNALVMAGQKIMRTPACPRTARAGAREYAASGRVHTMHPVSLAADVVAWRLLDGAWSRVPEVAGRYGVDDKALTAALDDYVTTLLVTGQPHEFENVPRLLAQQGIIPSVLLRMVTP